MSVMRVRFSYEPLVEFMPRSLFLESGLELDADGAPVQRARFALRRLGECRLSDLWLEAGLPWMELVEIPPSGSQEREWIARVDARVLGRGATAEITIRSRDDRIDGHVLPVAVAPPEAINVNPRGLLLTNRCAGQPFERQVSVALRIPGLFVQGIDTSDERLKVRCSDLGDDALQLMIAGRTPERQEDQIHASQEVTLRLGGVLNVRSHIPITHVYSN